MADQQLIRQLVAFATHAELLEAYRRGPAALADFLRPFSPGRIFEGEAALPSLGRRFVVKEGDPHIELVAAPKELLVRLQYEDPAEVMEVRKQVAASPPPYFLGIGTDIPIAATSYGGLWNPSEGDDPIFATRAAAARLVNANYLRQQHLSGSGVNVVMVDRGLDRESISNWGGGWIAGGRQPGTTVGGHGAMMVRNVLAIAPGATIFDCPVIPERITNIASFISDVLASYDQMASDISAWQRVGRYLGPWVFVNAWAIFDRKTEHPAGDYTNNPDHPFNVMIQRIAAGGFDLIFGAGNCGQFCPDKRCGPRDCGPGRSILGANSHRSVITVGAVRADGLWLGYSSQGPGQPNLDPRKPDLCAPSQFCEDHDASVTNTGTSAATAMLAGVVAALRSKWSASQVTPEELKELLLQNARRPDHKGWDGKLGYGILDVKATVNQAVERYLSKFN